MAILGWLTSFATALFGFGTAAVAGHVAASQAAEAIARLLRAGVFIALIIAAVNLILPPGATSISGLWATYSGQLGDVAGFIGLLFPLDLMFTLADWYIFAVGIMFTVSIIRRTFEASR